MQSHINNESQSTDTDIKYNCIITASAVPINPPNSPNQSNPSNNDSLAYRNILSTNYFTYPCKVLSPKLHTYSRPGEITPAVAYLLTYAGGIVSADQILMKITVEANSGLLSTTQASTKVYKNTHSEGNSAFQLLDVSIHPGALLLHVPHVVTCFAQSNYKQRQEFRLSSTGNLLLFDGITCGRQFYQEERWQMQRYQSLNEIYIDNELIVRDNLVLEKNQISSIASRMSHFNVIAQIYIFGPLFEAQALQLYHQINQRNLAKKNIYYSEEMSQKEQQEHKYNDFTQFILSASWITNKKSKYNQNIQDINVPTLEDVDNMRKKNNNRVESGGSSRIGGGLLFRVCCLSVESLEDCLHYYLQPFEEITKLSPWNTNK
jgi:urease accessory protein UreH